MHFGNQTRFQIVLFFSALLFMVTPAGAADLVMPGADEGTWLILIAMGILGIAVTILILISAVILLREFLESTAFIVKYLRALTPAPDVSITEVIPAGVSGRLEVRITGSSSVHFGQVTVILTSPKDFPLDEDHIILPRLGAGESKIVPLGYLPVCPGSYAIGVTAIFRMGDEDRIKEMIRPVRAEFLSGQKTSA